MDILIIIGLFFGAYILYVVIKNARATKRILKNGKKYIHSNFPDIPGKERFRTYVAGSHHYDQSIEPRVDNCLLLRRDPDNPYDKFAIKILNLIGEQVGFIPSDRSETLNESMKNGRQFYAMVDKIETNKADNSKNHYVISIHEIAKVDQTINCMAKKK